MTIRSLIFVTAIAILPLSALAQQYAPARKCPAYKLDPLELIRVGFTVNIKPGAVGCRTPEAYEKFLRNLVVEKGKPIAEELLQFGACFPGSQHAVDFQVRQIIEVAGGSCLVELQTQGDKRTGWTDISMISSLK